MREQRVPAFGCADAAYGKEPAGVVRTWGSGPVSQAGQAGSVETRAARGCRRTNAGTRVPPPLLGKSAPYIEVRRRESPDSGSQLLRPSHPGRGGGHGRSRSPYTVAVPCRNLTGFLVPPSLDGRKHRRTGRRPARPASVRSATGRGGASRCPGRFGRVRLPGTWRTPRRGVAGQPRTRSEARSSTRVTGPSRRPRTSGPAGRQAARGVADAYGTASPRCRQRAEQDRRRSPPGVRTPPGRGLRPQSGGHRLRTRPAARPAPSAGAGSRRVRRGPDSMGSDTPRRRSPSVTMLTSCRKPAARGAPSSTVCSGSGAAGSPARNFPDSPQRRGPMIPASTPQGSCPWTVRLKRWVAWESVGRGRSDPLCHAPA